MNKLEPTDRMQTLYDVYLKGGYTNACDFWDDVELLHTPFYESRRAKRQALYKYFGNDTRFIGDFELGYILDKVLKGNSDELVAQVRKGIDVQKRKEIDGNKQKDMNDRFDKLFKFQVIEVD